MGSQSKLFRESEQNSSAGRQRTGGSKVYLYWPNLPEGCIGIPDNFVLRGHAGINSGANYFGIARRPDTEKYFGEHNMY